MFCHTCQKEFEPWETVHRWVERHYCRSCHKDHWAGKRHDDHYCIKCGKPFPKKERKGKNGRVYFTSSGKKICSECSAIINKPKQRKCIVCGITITDRSYRYCPEHKPYQGTVNPITNRKSSLAWQKNNPQKVGAAQFARYRKDLLHVLYECPCNHPKKHNHHFNYELKNIVIRLCPSCHAAEHRRLRDLFHKAAVNE